MRRAINGAHRRHEPVHYRQVADTILAATNVHVSARSVRYWGRRLGARQMRTIPRSTEERQ
jgi:hypothetical protein